MPNGIKITDLTYSQVKAICNGVGPRGFSCLFPQFNLREVANQHDLDYTVGGGLREFVAANLTFFKSAMEKHYEEKNTLVRGAEAFAIYFYTTGVMLFGAPWFCWRGKPLTKPELDKRYPPNGR